MRVKNLTPFLAGAKVTSRNPPRPEMTLVVRAAYVLAPGQPLRLPDGPFPLSQGSLSAETFREEDEQRAGECLYPGDFADFKLRADVLLRGACHAPRGRAVTECPVRFSVGAWSKTLRVVGHRAWVRDAAGETTTEPLGFTRLPIGYENAFGGPGYPDNPVGRGFGTEQLPNVEHPQRRPRTSADRLEPAGFGPLSPAWPERAGKLGVEYGESYQRDRFPYYPVDFDWAFFNAAPRDQQIEGYLRGDEEVSFQNLHPAAANFSVMLPGLRVRAFVNDERGRLREVRMVLDTLFADLEGERLYLTWRGVEPVADGDLRDVTSVLVAAEPLAEAKKPEADYRAALEAFERDPLEKGDVADDPLGLAAAMIGAPVAARPPKKALDPITALLRAKLGGAAGPEQAKIAAAIARMMKVRMPPGVDLKALIAKAVNDLPAAGPGPIGGGLGAPRVPVGGALKKLLSNVAALKARAAQQGVHVPGLEKLDALAADPRLAALDPSFRPPGAPPGPEPGPGQDLEGADLTGRDLTGADLAGANLRGALLSRAILRSANLSGARLQGAVLFEADLTDANLEGADLTGANLSSATADGARFDGGVLDKANTNRARFQGASFREVKAADALFEEGDFGRAKLQRGVFQRCSFDDATLAGADFTGATLVRCRFERARAEEGVFERAVLTGSSFSGASLTKARFLEARGEGAVFIGATVTLADFRFAVLPLAHFSDASGKEARFRAASLRGARFYRADLERATFAQADLLGVDFSKAKLAGAGLGGASLYDAKLIDSDVAGADFEGANVDRMRTRPG